MSACIKIARGLRSNAIGVRSGVGTGVEVVVVVGVGIIVTEARVGLLVGRTVSVGIAAVAMAVAMARVAVKCGDGVTVAMSEVGTGTRAQAPSAQTSVTMIPTAICFSVDDFTKFARKSASHLQGCNRHLKATRCIASRRQSMPPTHHSRDIPPRPVR